MTDQDYAISDEWIRHKDYKRPFDYVLEPVKDGEKIVRRRGQKLLVRRVEMPDLLKHGLAAELDFMTKAIMTDSDKPQKEVVSDAVKNAESYLKMEAMVNAVCLAGIVKPKIYPVPEHDAARQKGLLYVDEIPWDDRQELFSVIFETQHLADFREEQESHVGDLANVQDVPLPADGPVEHSQGNSPGFLPQ